MVQKTVIITAGGMGKRMESDLPKQFLMLGSKSILQHCIEQFYQVFPETQIIVTLPSDWKNYWEELCLKNNFTIKHSIVEGGTERYDSIKHALEIAHGEIIAVHDGVRPLVSSQIIREAFILAEKEGSAVPIVPLKDSIRFVTEAESKALKRSDYFAVQTPQVFQADILRKAYEIPFHAAITDDASLVEESGVKLSLFPGEDQNIKITTPLDLKVAELLIENQA